MLGDFPLGAEPLGAIPGGNSIVSLPSTMGGAQRFPAPILHRHVDYGLEKYSKFDWFERQFLADWKKKGMAGLEENDEEQSLQAILRAQILERNE